jgi:hypothetical protein
LAARWYCAQGNTLFLFVDIDDPNVHQIASLHILMRVFEELIRQSADVNQAIAFRAEFGEHTKVGHAQDQRL